MSNPFKAGDMVRVNSTDTSRLFVHKNELLTIERVEGELVRIQGVSGGWYASRLVLANPSAPVKAPRAKRPSRAPVTDTVYSDILLYVKRSDIKTFTTPHVERALGIPSRQGGKRMAELVSRGLVKFTGEKEADAYSGRPVKVYSLAT